MEHEEVPLSRPDISDEDVEAVVSVLRTDRLSIGPQIEAFEVAVAGRAGRKYGIGVNSGTSGLHLCVRALGIGEGDEVITTPFSFVATTNAILFERARPVFVDIDPETYNMDPDAIEAAITSRTKAILPVEVFGNTAHFEEYEQIARKHGLLMIEDCCEALGGYLGGRPAGSFGECGVFGFYPNKQITTGEGGMIVTDSERTQDLCRAMRNQGRNDQTSVIHPMLGYNYRLGEMTAALGNAQMHRLDEILQKRRHAANTYNEMLADVEEIRLPTMAEPEKAAWFVYVIRLADHFTQDQRDEIIERLHAEGIGCRPYFSPIHLQPFIRELLGTRPGQFPETERVGNLSIALPFHTNMTLKAIRNVKQVLLKVLAASSGRAFARGRGRGGEAPAPRDLDACRELANRIRVHAVRMVHHARSSHIATSLSMAEILAVLYEKILHIAPDSVDDPDRDRLVLSKGHGCAGLYAVLAEKGFFPKDWLESFCVDGSRLAGHATHWGVPGVEVSTGSLGHGLSMANGMAYVGKLDGRAYRVFAVLSDGECDEGSTWEAAMFAGHHGLDNLIAIVDYNKIQSLGHVKDILDLEPFAAKWRSFGWSVEEIDGHDVAQVDRTLERVPLKRGRPACVVAHTVKGKGVSFMQDDVLWHYRHPQGEEYDAALRELGYTE